MMRTVLIVVDVSKKAAVTLPVKHFSLAKRPSRVDFFSTRNYIIRDDTGSILPYPSSPKQELLYQYIVCNLCDCHYNYSAFTARARLVTLTLRLKNYILIQIKDILFYLMNCKHTTAICSRIESGWFHWVNIQGINIEKT